MPCASQSAQHLRDLAVDSGPHDGRRRAAKAPGPVDGRARRRGRDRCARALRRPRLQRGQHSRRKGHRRRAYGPARRSSAVVSLLRSLRGRLLVASPPLIDPNFDRTVVLMLEHGDDGALGHRAQPPERDRRSTTCLPEWRRDRVGTRPSVFTGGPVSPDAVIALARRNARRPRKSRPMAGSRSRAISARSTSRAIRSISACRSTRCGSSSATPAGAPGQLESELAQGGWFVVAAEPDDPFGDEPEQMWRRVLRRQRTRVAMFAQYPDDVTTN